MACHTLQVYGGAISVTVGPFVRSFLGFGSSSASCGAVICDKLGLLIDGVAIQNSLSLSNTSGTVAIPSLLSSCLPARIDSRTSFFVYEYAI
jgi:hypothetical protein